MTITGCMEAGHGANKSQDRLLAFDTVLSNGVMQMQWRDDCTGCVGIFDGVGGIAGGSYASAYAAFQLSLCSAGSPEALYACLQGIGAHLRHHHGCATTASGLVFTQDRCYLFHCGNTRVWLFDGSYIEQITDDHTLVNESTTVLSPEEYYSISNVITGCLGGSRAELSEKAVVMDVTEAIQGVGQILFTCDGIHEYVDAFDIEQILREGRGLRKMITMARENGSQDDCSVMLLNR